MENKLVRYDYLQIGLNSKECLKVFEPFRHDDETIQFVVGDKSGILQSHKIRDGRLSDTMFRTMPGSNCDITAVEVVEGTPKVFAAVGSLMIRGLSRKGKQFFGLELNNLTEPIEHMKLCWPTDIFVCGKYVYNHYVLSPSSTDANIVQMKDAYVSPGMVSAMIVLSNNRIHIPVLATQDRLLRLVRDSKCEFELETIGIPVSLLDLSHATATSEFSFCYGCSDGKVTLVSMGQEKGAKPYSRWEFPESGIRSSVECMATCRQGKEIVIGRSDGAIEVWAFNGTLNLDGSENVDFDSIPFCRFVYNCNESITSICLTQDTSQILVSTFSGSVFGLQRKVTGNRMSDENIKRKIEELKEECRLLELNLAAEQSRDSDFDCEKQLNSLEAEHEVGARPFALKEDMVLCDDASYLMSVEAATAIDTLIVQCDVPLDIIDSEKNSAVVSFSETDTSEVLATFRCQTNTTRLELHIRPIEGQYGVMRIYVINRQTPKSCQLVLHNIRPLSLHKRVHSQNLEVRGRPSRLEVTGDFSVYEANNWISHSLPEVPDVVSSKDGVTYHFKSTLSATSLTCNISSGRIVLDSDNVSSISILKDFITRQATRKNVKIELKTDISEDSMKIALEMLYPLVQRLVLQKNYQRLNEAVSELRKTDPDVAESLSRDLAGEFDSSGQELKAISLDRVYGLITDLFIDQHKLKGTSSKSTLHMIKAKVQKLSTTVENMFLGENKVNESEFVERLLEFWTQDMKDM